MGTGTIDAEPVVQRRSTPAELIRSHQAGVWRYLRFLGADCAEADDLTQETLLDLLREGFEERSRAETDAYLRTSARRRLLMLRRKQGRERDLAVPLDELSLADQTWEAAAGDDGLESYLDALRECFATAVTDRVRDALQAQYRDRATRGQIAEQLDMTTEGVKTMLRRAKEKLRDCVEKKVQLLTGKHRHVRTESSGR